MKIKIPEEIELTEREQEIYKKGVAVGYEQGVAIPFLIIAGIGIVIAVADYFI